MVCFFSWGGLGFVVKVVLLVVLILIFTRFKKVIGIIILIWGKTIQIFKECEKLLTFKI